MANYTVVSGDTGDNIAQKLGITFSQLSAANPSVNWNNLQIGQVLNLPGSAGSTQSYNVVSGDTGDKIAQKFGITFAQLSAANPGVNWNNLQIGQTVKIPSGSSTPPSEPPTGGSPPPVNSPAKFYSGPAANFPSAGTWQTFDTLWNRNSQLMRGFDTADQVAFIKDGIITVEGESNPKIDRRVILCTIMQESTGNVHVPTTNNGVRNPGLMQSHNGVEFDQNNQKGSIFQMIRDGTTGTKDGDGLQQLLKKNGNIYAALRGYNSGSVNPNNLSDPLGATANYVSDIANRLLAAQGW